MSKQEVDRYIAALEEPKRSTLESLRETIAAIIPDADQVISYGMPGFRLNGKMIVGFAAFKTTSRTCRTVGPCSTSCPKSSPATR